MKTLMILILLATGTCSFAQQKPDTVIIELANTSKVVFTMVDRNDVNILRQYDFQSMFNDVLSEFSDSRPSDQPKVVSPAEEDSSTPDIENDSDAPSRHLWGWKSNPRPGRTYHSVNFDFGVNNYLSNGKFPDVDNELYAVRPWGSWYVAIHSMQHTRIGGVLNLDWGAGLSLYNFKFQQDNILISKNGDGVIFAEDNRDLNFIKSKLTASFVNATLVPMFEFGGNDKKSRFWGCRNSDFRLGAGPYVGYRIGSHSKLMYDDGDKEKEVERNNFYLNNFRYGIRLQLGIHSTDFFFNYDLNDLFITKPNNPELNAFSFGVTF